MRILIFLGIIAASAAVVWLLTWVSMSGYGAPLVGGIIAALILYAIWQLAGVLTSKKRR